MKKICKSIFNVVIIIGILLPTFCQLFLCKVTNGKEIANATNFYEDDIKIEQEIVSVGFPSASSGLRDYAVEYQSPYSLKTHKMLEGYSFVPSYDEYYQTNDNTFVVNNFSMKSDESIFMWIYLPDDPTSSLYSLSISFFSGLNSSIVWKLSNTELIDLIGENYSVKYGWKFLELSYEDAIKTSANEKTIFSSFSIKYFFDTSVLDIGYDIDYDLNLQGKRGPLAFYHIYTATSLSNKTNIVLQLNYFNYKVKESFNNKIENIYLDDYFTIQNLSEIFDSVYVGRYNLLLQGTQNNSYSWSHSLQTPSSTINISYGKKYQLKTSGWYYYTISMNEIVDGKQNELLSLKFSFNVKEFDFGYFDKTSFRVDAKKDYILIFKMRSNFDMTNEINISSSDESIFKIKNYSYNSEGSYYAIEIDPIKKGNADLIISATGTRNFDAEKTYSSSTNIVVNGTDTFFSAKVWLLIGIFYLCVIIIFAIVSYFNSKKIKKLL